MILTNYHTHYNICDGKGEPEDFIERAIELGFKQIGFSSHAPLPQPAEWTMQRGELNHYCNKIRSLKEQYSERITVYLGLEVDYIPGWMGPHSEEFLELDLDYVIGSIHCFENPHTGEFFGIDGPYEEYDQVFSGIFGGNMYHLVRNYYQRIREMVSLHRPDIVGHMDLIKMRNPDNCYYSESDTWYRGEIMETLDEIAAQGTIVEINTGGKTRGKTKEFYPGSWIVRECYQRNIPLTINSDAHEPAHLDSLLTEAARVAWDAGYREVMMLHDHDWHPVPLEHETLQR
jgi:histidinol-phosphatase (PHP family)